MSKSKTWRDGRTRVSAMVTMCEFRWLQQRQRQQRHAQGHQQRGQDMCAWLHSTRWHHHRSISTARGCAAAGRSGGGAAAVAVRLGCTQAKRRPTAAAAALWRSGAGSEGHIASDLRRDLPRVRLICNFQVTFLVSPRPGFGESGARPSQLSSVDCRFIFFYKCASLTRAQASVATHAAARSRRASGLLPRREQHAVLQCRRET